MRQECGRLGVEVVVPKGYRTTTSSHSPVQKHTYAEIVKYLMSEVWIVWFIVTFL